MENRRTYLAIGDGRLLNIRVILDEKCVYEGMVEEAPESIKTLKYSEIQMGNPVTYIVYSELNLKLCKSI